MNFFAHQDKARKKSKQLIWLFLLAVTAIVIAINFVVMLVIGTTTPSGMGQDIAVNLANPAIQKKLLIATAITLGIIGLSSLYRMADLRSGGASVAKAMGGTQIMPGSRDRLHQRLYNVVEEISLASGVPVPDVFVMEQEEGINAFAAGFEAGDAAVAVTRGCLEKLNREELQGVIAHEYSHILNGDMRLNIRLMGWLYGILVLAIIGQNMMRGASFSRRKEGGGMVMVGLAVMVIGYIGVFFGRLIQSAVSRQREYLADASAVQFTRAPEGIANALKKIAGYSAGSDLHNSHTQEVSHMLFSRGLPSLNGMFATHPPIEKRIQALDPSFKGMGDLPRVKSSGPALSPAAAGFAGGGGHASLANTVGQVQQESIQQAAEQIQAIPAPLTELSHDRDNAHLLVFAILLSDEALTRQKQLDVVELEWDEAAKQKVAGMAESLAYQKDGQYIALLELAFPSIKLHDRSFIQNVIQTVDKMIRVDGKIAVREFALKRMLSVSLTEALQPGKHKKAKLKLHNVQDECARVLSLLAGVGHASKQECLSAYAAGMHELFPRQHPPFQIPERWADQLDKDLDKLDQLLPLAKEILLQGVEKTVMHDRKLTAGEREIVGAVSASIHCPLPL